MERLISLAFVLIIPTLLITCSTISKSSDATNLVQANANLIAQIQVSRILEHAAFQGLFQQDPKISDDSQNFDELLTNAQEKTRIDFSKFSTATVYADVTGDAKYFGVIARGPVDEQLLVATMTATAEVMLTHTEYKDVQIYTEELGHKNQAIAVLDNDATVRGTVPAIQDVIDAKQETMSEISGPVHDSFNCLGIPFVGLAAAILLEPLADFEDSMVAPRNSA